MPWGFLAGYVATKVLDKAIDTVLFNEKFRDWFRRTGIAEQYLSLNAEQLLSFYRNESPLDVSLAGRRYVLPMSVVLESTVSAGTDILCETEPGSFTVPERLIAYTQPVKDVLEKDRKSFDGRVTRLYAHHENKLILQEASYFEGVSTNFAVDHRPKGRTESLREMLHANTSSFGGFESNPLVNHIGVVCMVETIDGMLIVQKRSRNVTNRGGTLSSSVSGVVDWTDIRSQQSPFSINTLAESIYREANKELGVAPNQIVFLGLLREFLRGGKPEVYYFARTEEPFGTLRTKWLQAEHREESTDITGYEFHSDRIDSGELSRDSLKARVRHIMEEIGQDANLTLTAGIALTTKHVLDGAL